MPSSYTGSLRLELQATGENLGSLGAKQLDVARLLAGMGVLLHG